MWARRRFLRNAAAGVAGVALASPFLAACGDGPGTVTGAAGGVGDGGPAAATAFRLSTRNQRSACGACKSHASHRYFASAEAAAGNRAHPGCTCEVLAQPVSPERYGSMFGATGGVVYDDRWMPVVTN